MTYLLLYIFRISWPGQFFQSIQGPSGIHFFPHLPLKSFLSPKLLPSLQEFAIQTTGPLQRKNKAIINWSKNVQKSSLISWLFNPGNQQIKVFLRDVLEWHEMKKSNTKNILIISEVLANYSEVFGYFSIRW